MVVLSLTYKDRLFYQALSDGVPMFFGSGAKDTVKVPSMNEHQISVTAKGESLSVQALPPYSFSKGNLPIGTSIRIASGLSIFSSRATGEDSQKYALPLNGIIKVGRHPSNDITIGLPFVSGSHFNLRITEGSVRVEDQQSTNGLFLNGTKIRSAIMRSGDVLNILTVRIKLVNTTLVFENVGRNLSMKRPSSASPSPKAPQPAKSSAPKASSAVKPASPAPVGRRLTFRLSPRLQSELPKEPIVLDRPPRKGQEYHPSGNRIASIVSMGAMAGMGLAMGAVSPALAFARTASLAAGVFNMFAAGKMDKQRQAEMEEYNRRRDEEYRTYIEAQRALILASAQEQRSIITEENPAPEKCVEMVKNLDRRIWERMSSDRDFLDVRIGMGYEELCVPIKNYAENRGLMMEDDELEALCNNIAEENRLVDFVPARVPLRKTPTLGIYGNRKQAVHLVRNMLISLTTLHSANDVQVVGIFDSTERMSWGAMRWLPHVWDNSRQYRYLAFDAKRAHAICDMLQENLTRRMDSKKDDYGQKKAAPLPHYVVILGSRELTANEPVMSLLTSENASQLGVSTIFLYDDLYYMPRECRQFIDLTQDYPFYYDRFHANKRVAFSRDTSVAADQFDAFARRMAAIELEQTAAENALPSSITFLEGFGVKTVEQLNILKRWRSHPVTDTLTTPIGVLSSGAPFSLDIHYKAHGAHGLMAGTTGSGKSELLRTWILSMAANYHPHEVNFVIIDYKGGGMANKLEALPHVVGKITNIDTNITRSLVSLKREAKRRMILLESYPGVDDVDQYMQLYYAGKATEPMPHLIIVSDEFAELKKEEPDFMKELSSLARVGRSVGMHLVLATQRPTGVVDDQIDSNSRFRVCMKVNSVQDSKEMIKRPDAAGITQRGRAYVRIGEDESFCLIQSFWSGAAYNSSQDDSYTNQVRIVDVSGERLQTGQKTTKSSSTVGSDQLTAIVNHINQQAAQAKITSLPGPWRPELPELLTIQDLQISTRFNEKEWPGHNHHLRVPIGLYDRPSLQEQGIQYLDFTVTAHYGIYGGPASGKTTLLQTLMLNLSQQFSPDEVNLYILDFGGRSLSIFAGLPHTAAVIHEDETDKLAKFTTWITSEIKSRKLCFQKEKVTNYNQYCTIKHDMPAVFVVIDNLLKLTTLVEGIDQFLIDLTMTGSDSGIHVVYTSSNLNKTNMNLRTNIGGNIVLHMVDHSDYRTAIQEMPEGSGWPNNPGRGLIRDTAAAEFQTAVFLVHKDAHKNMQALERLVKQMADSWKGPEVQSIKSMPETISTESMAKFYGVRDVLPLGLDYDNLQAVYMDLSEKHSMLLSSAKEKDGIKVMIGLGKLLLTRQENRLYIADGSGNLSDLKGKAAIYASDKAQMNRLVQSLAQEAEKREDALYAELDGSPGTCTQRPQLCILIDRMDQVMSMLTEENQSLLVNICQTTEKLGILSIAHGTIENLQSYMLTENLTTTFVDYPIDSDFAENNWQKGLCIGGKLRRHDAFVMKMLDSTAQNSQLAEGDGYVFDCGKAVHIRYVQ